MRAFEENKNNDIFSGENNQLSVVSGLQATVQAAKAAVEIQLGEAKYSKDRGIPTDRAVWSGAPNIPQFEYYARKQILSVPDVTEIETFRASIAGETLNYEATIKTIYGQGELSGTV